MGSLTVQMDVRIKFLDIALAQNMAHGQNSTKGVVGGWKKGALESESFLIIKESGRYTMPYTHTG